MRRQSTVEVRDLDGQLIPGAEVTVEANGQIVGSIKDSAGRAIIDYPDHAFVVVRVTVAGFSQIVSLQAIEGIHTLQFPRPPAVNPSPMREACCANGLCGQPCVDCQLTNGDVVRICA